MSRSTSFDELFDGMQDPALVLDAESGAIKAANRSAGHLLGYTQTELEGMTAADFHAHELPRLRDFMNEVARNGAWQSDAMSCRTRTGELVPAEIRSTAFHPASGSDQELLVLIRDLRGEQLAEVGRSVRKLVHDLRNALTTAQLLSDRLSGHEDAHVRAGADVMSRSLERALQLCQQTMLAGRAEEQKPDPTRFMLDDVVEELQATTILPGGIGPQLDFDSGDAVLLDADFDQVYRILLNLVRNASDAGAVHVAISGRRDDGLTHITVSDDGPGLPEEILRQLHTDKAGTGSTGLGLMIASELAQGHGGGLEVVRTGAGGTVFEITIPDQG